MYDPNYKMKYRPDPIGRLSRYAGLPPPMVGEPSEARESDDPAHRLRVLYDLLMEKQKGLVPKAKRRGLWFHATEPRP